MAAPPAAPEVTKVGQRLVLPAKQTPTSPMELSWLDRYPTQMALIESLHVFKDGCKGIAKTIESALSAALVHYYPLAGRLAVSGDGQRYVDCSGGGIWFIEATASCRLEDVDYLDCPLQISKDELLPHPQPALTREEEDEQIILVQVTEFACGGFVVGFRFSHSVADGPGAAQFMSAIGELARGEKQLSSKPVWARDAIPNPVGAPIGPLPEPNGLHLEYLAVDISMEYINHFKNRLLAQTGTRCSAFEVLIAKAWQSRARAVDFPPGTEMTVAFSMNVRSLVQSRLPGEGGFYGNCYYIMRVSAASERVAGSSIAEVVKIIKDGKKRLPAEFEQWAAGKLPFDPFQITSDYRTLLVSDWTRLGLAEVDYGWGTPAHVVPLANLDYIATCILVKPWAHKPGARLITQCVTADRVEAFHCGMLDME